VKRKPKFRQHFLLPPQIIPYSTRRGRGPDSDCPDVFTSVKRSPIKCYGRVEKHEPLNASVQPGDKVSNAACSRDEPGIEKCRCWLAVDSPCISLLQAENWNWNRKLWPIEQSWIYWSLIAIIGNFCLIGYRMWELTKGQPKFKSDGEMELPARKRINKL